MVHVSCKTQCTVANVMYALYSNAMLMWQNPNPHPNGIFFFSSSFFVLFCFVFVFFFPRDDLSESEASVWPKCGQEDEGY